MCFFSDPWGKEDKKKGLGEGLSEGEVRSSSECEGHEKKYGRGARNPLLNNNMDFFSKEEGEKKEKGDSEGRFG